MSRTRTVQAENASVVASPLRRTACALVGITGWPYQKIFAHSFYGRMVGATLQITIAL